jgi:hypothetical protein
MGVLIRLDCTHFGFRHPKALGVHLQSPNQIDIICDTYILRDRFGV